MADIHLSARVKAFSHEGVRLNRIRVTDTKIMVWDEVGQLYTTCHSLSARTQRRLRRIADAIEKWPRTLPRNEKGGMMRYVFLIVLENGCEDRVGFVAESEEEARNKAIEWAESGSVGECVERWSVERWSVEF